MKLWVRLNGKGGQNYPTLPYISYLIKPCSVIFFYDQLSLLSVILSLLSVILSLLSVILEFVVGNYTCMFVVGNSKVVVVGI